MSMQVQSDTDEPPPANSNEGCIGPSNPNAGKSTACEGCPNQSVCASGKFASPAAQLALSAEHEDIRVALTNVSYVVLILSGKGGVGKSTVCCQLAQTLAHRRYSVGVLDVDICGPSVARMLGVTGREVHRSGSGWTPVYANENLAVMSVSFLLPDADAAVVWRGPRKNGMIKQFLTETCWDEEGLDYLLIDTPPGTSDEHISTVQYLQGALGGERESGVGSLGGAIVVTTPEEVAMSDVRKELNFCVKTKVPVIGVVENMGIFQTKITDMRYLKLCSQENGKLSDCTDEVLRILKEKCPEILDLVASADVFPPSGTGPRGMAAKFNVPYLGALPLDPNLLRSCENGLCFVSAFPESTSVSPLNALVDKLLQALPVEEVEMQE